MARKLLFMDIAPSLTDSHEYGLLVNQLGTFETERLRSRARLMQLEQAAAYRAAAIDLVARLVDECAKDVQSWNSPTEWKMVGDALGVTAQAASQGHKRWKAAQK